MTELLDDEPDWIDRQAAINWLTETLWIWRDSMTRKK